MMIQMRESVCLNQIDGLQMIRCCLCYSTVAEVKFDVRRQRVKKRRVNETADLRRQMTMRIFERNRIEAQLCQVNRYR